MPASWPVTRPVMASSPADSASRHAMASPAQKITSWPITPRRCGRLSSEACFGVLLSSWWMPFHLPIYRPICMARSSHRYGEAHRPHLKPLTNPERAEHVPHASEKNGCEEKKKKFCPSRSKSAPKVVGCTFRDTPCEPTKPQPNPACTDRHHGTYTPESTLRAHPCASRTSTTPSSCQLDSLLHSFPPVAEAGHVDVLVENASAVLTGWEKEATSMPLTTKRKWVALR